MNELEFCPRKPLTDAEVTFDTAVISPEQRAANHPAFGERRLHDPDEHP